MVRLLRILQQNRRDYRGSIRAAIDLASIMVGVIIIGLLGGVISATVFAVIPWAQDRAAEASAQSVTAAESVSRAKDSKYQDSSGLAASEYLSANPAATLVSVNPTGTCYIGVTKYAGTKYFYVTDRTRTPQTYSTGDESLTSYCAASSSLVDLVGQLGGPVAPEMALTVNAALNDPVSTASCKSFTLPVAGTIAATVDWGDGSAVQTLTSSTPLPTHVYATAASFDVKIAGTFTKYGAFPNSDNTILGPYEASTGCITKVDKWTESTGTTFAAGAYAWFPGTSGVAAPPSTVKNLVGVFYNAASFNQDISSWKTGNVVSMVSGFRDTNAFNQPLNSWNTSKLVNLDYAFYNAKAFNQPLNGWNTSNVTSLFATFWLARDFNQSVNSWDVSKVTVMFGTFGYTNNYNQPLNNWNTSHATDMGSLFYRATAFSQDVSGWNVSSVTDHSNFNFNCPIPGGYLPAFPS